MDWLPVLQVFGWAAGIYLIIALLAAVLIDDSELIKAPLEFLRDEGIIASLWWASILGAITAFVGASLSLVDAVSSASTPAFGLVFMACCATAFISGVPLFRADEQRLIEVKQEAEVRLDLALRIEEALFARRKAGLPPIYGKDALDAEGTKDAIRLLDTQLYSNGSSRPRTFNDYRRGLAARKNLDEKESFERTRYIFDTHLKPVPGDRADYRRQPQPIERGQRVIRSNNPGIVSRDRRLAIQIAQFARDEAWFDEVSDEQVLEAEGTDEAVALLDTRLYINDLGESTTFNALRKRLAEEGNIDDRSAFLRAQVTFMGGCGDGPYRPLKPWTEPS